jgi:hypothetical protein
MGSIAKPIVLAAAAVLLQAACASAPRKYDAQVDRALDNCALLSGADARNEEVRYWFHVERVRISRGLWSPAGIRALESRRARVQSDADKACLERVLREARGREVEHYW